MRFTPLKNRFFSIVSAFVYLFIVVFVAFISYKQGFSQYYTKSATISQDVSKLTQAFAFDSTNPEIYKVRGIFSQQNGNFQVAASEFKQAIDLRANDYFLWLQLGFTNNKLKDFEQAKAAYEKSIELAPNYFQPRQYLGYFYLRQNNIEKAFTQLSQAAASKPTLLPEVLQLAFQVFEGNPVSIENAVHPKSIEAKKEMANFFIKNNIISDKTIAFLQSNELNETDKNQFINQLIQIKNYKLAFSIWASKGENKEILQNSAKNLVLNGDFENPVSSDKIGFSWLIQDIPNADLKLDDNKPYSGAVSLQILFSGKSDPTNPIISQLVIVKPNQQYKLTFAVRDEELVSGGLPVVTVIDADSGKIINQSAALSSANNQWQKYVIDFKTSNQTQALIIRVQRLICKENPCPIFGKLWLDGFNLREF